MKAVLFSFKFLIVLGLIHFGALAQANDCPKPNNEELKSNNETYVEIQAGGSSVNLLKEESIAPFDLESQRKRVTECGNGAVTCFKQFPENIKNGEMLISYKFGDGLRGVPKVKSMEIVSSDFKNINLMSCLKSYWSSFIIPNVGATNGHTGSVTVSVIVKKSSKAISHKK
jgi:hypothetical protein